MWGGRLCGIFTYHQALKKTVIGSVEETFIAVKKTVTTEISG